MAAGVFSLSIPDQPLELALEAGYCVGEGIALSEPQAMMIAPSAVGGEFGEDSAGEVHSSGRGSRPGELMVPEEAMTVGPAATPEAMCWICEV